MAWAKDPEARKRQEANLAKGRKTLAQRRAEGTASAPARPAKRRSQPTQHAQPAPPKPTKPARKAPAKPKPDAAPAKRPGFLQGLFGGG